MIASVMKAGRRGSYAVLQVPKAAPTQSSKALLRLKP